MSLSVSINSSYISDVNVRIEALVYTKLMNFCKVMKDFLNNCSELHSYIS